MELGFIESLRRRWKVLGLSIDSSEPISDISEEGAADVMEADEVMPMDVEGLAPTLKDAKPIEQEGEAARKEIMSGAIVKTVIDNAVEGL